MKRIKRVKVWIPLILSIILTEFIRASTEESFAFEQTSDKNSIHQINNSKNYLNRNNNKIIKLKKDNKNTSGDNENMKSTHLQNASNEYYNDHSEKNIKCSSLEEKYEVTKKQITELINELEIMRRKIELTKSR